MSLDKNRWIPSSVDAETHHTKSLCKYLYSQEFCCTASMKEVICVRFLLLIFLCWQQGILETTELTGFISFHIRSLSIEEVFICHTPAHAKLMLQDLSQFSTCQEFLEITENLLKAIYKLLKHTIQETQWDIADYLKISSRINNYTTLWDCKSVTSKL